MVTSSDVWDVVAAAVPVPTDFLGWTCLCLPSPPEYRCQHALRPGRKEAEQGGPESLRRGQGKEKKNFRRRVDFA